MRPQQREERDVPGRVHGRPRGQAASAHREAEEQHDVGDVREQERGQPDDEPQVAGDVQQRVPAPRQADRDEQQHRHRAAQGPSRQQHGEREGGHEEQLRRAAPRRRGPRPAPPRAAPRRRCTARRRAGCAGDRLARAGMQSRRRASRWWSRPRASPDRTERMPRARHAAWSRPTRHPLVDMPKAGGLAPTGLRIGRGAQLTPSRSITKIRVLPESWWPPPAGP